ncbi:MAG: hypothetical protein Athens071416_137 [Parcubacteria group bacterium Athens0714_16]|nr:MAG: hypothetical protein Athens071416_137 [Parcubacteria group bacterium Athens0714_16]
MERHGTSPKKATTQQVLDLQHEFGRVFQNIPFDLAKKILSNKTQTRKLLTDVCKKLNIPFQSESILTQLPLLEKYYQEVYGITLDLSGITFPENPDFPVIMVDDLSQYEDQIMDCIQKFFNKPDSPVNLYKYKNPVAKNIDRESEKLQVRTLQSGLVVFAHKGGDEPDLLNMSYNTTIEKKIQFMKYREYLRATGFHRFTKGYFMDRNGWTRTSSLWFDGYLVIGSWFDGDAELCADSDNVDRTHPYDGPRQLFLSLP